MIFKEKKEKTLLLNILIELNWKNNSKKTYTEQKYCKILLQNYTATEKFIRYILSGTWWESTGLFMYTRACSTDSPRNRPSFS